MHIKISKTVPLLIILFLLYTPQHTYGEKGVVIVPVADLIGQPIQSFFPGKSTQQAYKDLSESGDCIICPRMHQLLFNETVEILEKNKNEMRVRIPNLFYTTRASNAKQTDYWTSQANIIPYTDLKKNKININQFPKPIDFGAHARHKQNLKICHRNTVTLTMPFHDPITDTTFSAGTRFVQAKKNNKSTKSIDIYVYNPKKKCTQISTIPTSHCFIDTNQTQTQRVQSFVSLVQQWAHLNNGFIPYVWGGCSFTSRQTGPFKQRVYLKNKPPKNNTLFTYPNNKTSPKCGLDCAGLVARATQICGMPYFLKNTTTLATHLDPLGPQDRIAAGDLIFIPGHVIIITDTNKNFVVEARGYNNGCGKIHETTIGTLFKDIKTIDDLVNAYRKKKRLYRLNEHGEVFSTTPEFKLLKLASIWNT